MLKLKKKWIDDPKAQENLMESVRAPLVGEGFDTKDVEHVDIIATKGTEYILFEFKSVKQGYLTYDSIAQAKTKAKECGERFHSKVMPIVVGTFTATGSTQSIAKENDVRLLTIPSDITTEDLKPFITKELKNLLTDVS